MFAVGNVQHSAPPTFTTHDAAGKCYTFETERQAYKKSETRDSISLLSYADCLALSPAKIHSKCASQPKMAKNSLKTHILGFKVVQGHRCWYPRKARQQCLL